MTVALVHRGRAEASAFARDMASLLFTLRGGHVRSGAAAAVAVRLAQQEDFAGKTIVVILPDGGERYLSSVLFEDIEA